MEILLGQCYTEELEKELDGILKRQKELLLKKSEDHHMHQSKNPPFRKKRAKDILLCENGKIKSEGNTIQSLYDKNGIQQCETSQVIKITEDYY